MQTPTPKNVWDNHARQWNRLTSPLRPCDQDLDLMKQGIKPIVGRCLLLGVTPEFCCLSDNLIAIDHNASMIRAVWPGNNNRRNIVQGDWLHLPFRPGAFDAVIGDGCLTLMHYPLSYELLFSELRRVLKNPGKLLLRLFATPDEGEVCSAVYREALEKRIGSFHAFKWRLAMALVAESGKPNVRVRDIYETFNQFCPDRERLAKQASWDPQDIATIEAYRDSSAIYSFPQLSYVRLAFQPYFKETGILNGTYELAERCPVLFLESY